MLKKLSTSIMCLTIGSSVALAQGARLEEKVGAVSVYNGDGFKVAQEGTVLKPSDVVYVQQNSSVFLTYADGCRVKLKAGRVVTVRSTPCAEKRELADLPDRKAAPAMPVMADPGGIGGIGGAPLVGVAALAAGGIAAGVILATRNNNNGPFPGGGGGNGQPMSP